MAEIAHLRLVTESYPGKPTPRGCNDDAYLSKSDPLKEQAEMHKHTTHATTIPENTCRHRARGSTCAKELSVAVESVSVSLAQSLGVSFSHLFQPSDAG